uniref:Uncharacterized protein n=1 Tax=Ananas comosus var. bracteatus TaxID=296719 RepID=A0A6V7PF52_ANACO|nr:unnamed protein product [Ananas comosus var. bracteatus]
MRGGIRGWRAYGSVGGHGGGGSSWRVRGSRSGSAGPPHPAGQGKEAGRGRGRHNATIVRTLQALRIQRGQESRVLSVEYRYLSEVPEPHCVPEWAALGFEKWVLRTGTESSLDITILAANTLHLPNEDPSHDLSIWRRTNRTSPNNGFSHDSATWRHPYRTYPAMVSVNPGGLIHNRLNHPAAKSSHTPRQWFKPRVVISR